MSIRFTKDDNINWSVLPSYINGHAVTDMSFLWDTGFGNDASYYKFLITDGKSVYKNSQDLKKQRSPMKAEEANRLLTTYEWYTKEDLKRYDPAVTAEDRNILYCLDKITNGLIYYENPLESHYMVYSFSTDRFDVKIDHDEMWVYYKDNLIAAYKKGEFKRYHNYHRSGPASQYMWEEEELWTLTKIVDWKLKRNIEDEILQTLIRKFNLTLKSVKKNNGLYYEYPIKFRNKGDYVTGRKTKSKINKYFYADTPENIKAGIIPPVIGRKFNVNSSWYEPAVDKAITKRNLNEDVSIQDCKSIIDNVSSEVINRFRNNHYLTGKYTETEIRGYTEKVVMWHIREMLIKKVV